MFDQWIHCLTADPLGLANAIVCVGISFHGVCVINKMRRDTSMIRWFGYALLTCGAFAVAIEPVYGKWSADASEALMNIGLLIAAAHAAYAGQPILKESQNDQ